jgi:hypothetical protein
LPEFSSKYGVQFCGKHTGRDFGLKVTDKKITMPEKDPVTIKAPYRNGVIDLSNLYGHQVFKDRQVQMTFLLTAWETHTKEQLYREWTAIVNWCEREPGRQPLVDDIMSDYYYMGQVTTAPDWDEFRLHGKLTIVWTCDPFRIYRPLEGSDIWDEFDFEFGVAQETSFTVAGTKKVTLLNTGMQPEQPTIVASVDFTVAVSDGKTYQIKAGTITPQNAAQPFTLPKGVVSLTITGTGKIEFQWHKEVI